MELPDGPTEESTERDGLLSYAKEWHVLIVGLGAGLLTGATGQWEGTALIIGVALGIRAIPKGPLGQVKKEPWYAIGGVLIGYTVGALTTGSLNLPF